MAKVKLYWLDERIIELAQNPKNVGKIEGENVYYTRIANPICGDITDLYVKIENGMVKDAKFLTFGCFVTIASASVLTEVIKGKNIEELLVGEGEEIIERIKNLINEQLGKIPKQKLHCPPASVEAFLRVAENYYSKKDKGKIEKIENLLKIIPSYYKEGREEKEENVL